MLRELRIDYGWTIAELAERVGRHKNFIGQVELGKKLPSDATVNALAEALDVSRAIFFEESE